MVREEADKCKCPDHGFHAADWLCQMFLWILQYLSGKLRSNGPDRILLVKAISIRDRSQSTDFLASRQDFCRRFWVKYLAFQ
jgi:hypothetical protein